MNKAAFNTKQISTSSRSPHYVPYFMLQYFSVYFNGQELGVSGPEGMKCADYNTGVIELNNGRLLKGKVEIIEEAPF